jgi:two-component SAPR family response regulator
VVSETIRAAPKAQSQEIRQSALVRRRGAYAGQVTALDGVLNESPYRGLMFCHQQLGDHSEALQAYRRCRELLTRFLGIPPNAKTQALYHSVRERAAYAPAGGER